MTRDDLVGPRSLRRDLGELAAGGDSVSRYLTAMCDRIASIDPFVHAFLPEPDRRDRVLTAGAQARGPWQGLPVGIKDIIRVDGLPTLAGSTVPPSELAGPQASVVSRLLDAGAVVAGKTVTAEFAVAAPGPTANPHNLGHTPGGSSSGSAAAVAAGLVPLALGTQTVASIIRPAAYCGVVGFRTTHGRVGLDGVLPNAPSLDAIGWFTAGIADTVLAAQLICDDWICEPILRRPPVLGVPSRRFLTEASDAGRRAFDRHVRILRKAGFEVRERSLFEDFEDVGDRLFVINRWELAAAHDDLFKRHGARYRPETATAVRQGQQIDGADYLSALKWQRDYAASYAEKTADAGVDVWLAPAATGTAPAGLSSTGDSAMSFPFSLVGAPAISLPAGSDANGMPWGLQCAAVPGADEHLLAACSAIEAALSEHS
jgi:Asp-tRNA(Asn)/Glu-tRNA(Gln) amidotransferase A subunit family amidase